MESLRWILLVAGIVFVLVIYILGRSRRRRNHSVTEELDDDLPEFAARSLDDVDEGVGEVRIISGTNDEISSINISAADDYSSEDVSSETEEAGQEKSRKPSDIIVLYILPKGDEHLLGAQINSSAQAMGLKFGEMNIFHYTNNGRNVFSMANMLEPGYFDADTIHDLKTSGLTVFMQISGNDPIDDLTEMLQRSYQMAGLLGARLCNHKRAPLTEQDAENYRTQVHDFVSSQDV